MRKLIYGNIYELEKSERPDTRKHQDYSKIPEQLKTTGRFCCWFYAWDASRESKTKIPANPVSGRWAKTDDPNTFADFAVALRHYLKDKKIDGAMKYDGLGLRISDSFIGLDFDNCFDEHGVLNPAVEKLVKQFNSYTEISPSGRGLRLICTGEIPVKAEEFKRTYYQFHSSEIDGRGFSVEIYVPQVTNRFCTITGNVLSIDGTCMERLGERTTEIMNFLEVHMKKPETSTVEESRSVYIPDPADELTDEEIIRLLLNNGDEETRKLWAGDFSDFVHKDGSKAGEPDHSAGDYALCDRIAFYASDAEQIDRVFRESGMYRDKWDDDHYRNFTLDKLMTNRKTNGAKHYSKSYRSEPPSIESSFDDLLQGSDPSRADQEQTQEDKRSIILKQSNFYLFDKFEETVNDPNNEPWPTGLKPLDKALGGGLFPEFVILGAPPSMGKSALVEQISDNFAADGHDILYYSFEMSREQMIARSISRIAYLGDLHRNGSHNLSKTFRDIYCGHFRKNFSEAERDLIAWAGEEYLDKIARHIYVRDRSSGATIESIERDAETWADAFGTAPVIVADYLQICPHRTDIRFATDKMELDYVVSILQKIQRKYKNRVILISALNRAGSDRQEMQSFSGTSKIEYSSDTLLTLYDWTREGKDEKQTPDVIKHLYDGCKKHGYAYGMHIAVVKQRFGLNGARVDLAANLKYSCFLDSREVDKPSEDERKCWEME